MRCYTLFCDTSKCKTLAGRIADRLNCKVIYPQQVQHTWSQGKMVDIQHDLLPGYIFLYLEDDKAEERPGADADLQASIKGLNIAGIYYCLHYNDGTYALKGSDEQFALMLLRNDGIIGKTKVYQVGDRIMLQKGAYAGVDTKILKVDHRNRRIQIEIPFARMFIKTWVEYEMVEEEV